MFMFEAAFERDELRPRTRSAVQVQLDGTPQGPVSPPVAPQTLPVV
jgi:hypothetical protein